MCFNRIKIKVSVPLSIDQPPNSNDSVEKQGSSVRKILDQRRQLVMQFFSEKGLFPSSMNWFYFNFNLIWFFLK